MSGEPPRAAALISRHEATRRHVVAALGAAGLQLHAAPAIEELAVAGKLAAVLVDLDVDPSATVESLIERVRTRYPATPIFAVAGIAVQERLLSAFSLDGVDHVIPKRGAPRSNGRQSEIATLLDGPDRQALFAAMRRVLGAPASPGVELYLLAGASVCEQVVYAAEEREVAIEEVRHFAEGLGFRGERLRRVELCTEELLLNALLDAPLRAGASHERPARLRFGCDGERLAISVLDEYGTLGKTAIARRLQLLASGVLRSVPGSGGAGLGLAMTYLAANQLLFSVVPGVLTEATAVLHVGTAHRDAQSMGCAMHFFRHGWHYAQT